MRYASGMTQGKPLSTNAHDNLTVNRIHMKLRLLSYQHRHGKTGNKNEKLSRQPVSERIFEHVNAEFQAEILSTRLSVTDNFGTTFRNNIEPPFITILWAPPKLHNPRNSCNVLKTITTGYRPTIG